MFDTIITGIISVSKQLIYFYETNASKNIPVGITLIKEEHGYFHYNYRERINGPVYIFMSKTNPIGKIKFCPAISAELIIDEKEGIDVTDFINKLSGPDGTGYKDWSPEDIANYLNVRYDTDVKIALIVSEGLKLLEFSNDEYLMMNV